MSSDVAIGAPTSVDELIALLRDAAASGSTVGIAGAGSKAGWGGIGRPTDRQVSTVQLAGVVEYAPGDLVATVRAGTRLADLQDELAANSHWLALDPPEKDATIGGILATAAGGPHRLRFGMPRDQLIGITVALADGTLAKSGGKVVKNVAGYDLGKLFTGSYGTLGVIVSATFKLQPQPLATRVVSLPTDSPGAAWAAVASTRARPSAVEWDGSQVHVLVEAAASAVDGIADTLATTLGAAVVADQVPEGFGERPWASGQVALKLTHRLSALDDVIAASRRLLAGARLAAHVGSGVVWCGWTASGSDQVTAAVDELRATLTSYDGTAVLVDAPDDVKTQVDVWGPVRAVSLMRRIKDQFDPDHRLNPGRFVDGI